MNNVSLYSCNSNKKAINNFSVAAMIMTTAVCQSSVVTNSLNYVFFSNENTNKVYYFSTAQNNISYIIEDLKLNANLQKINNFSKYKKNWNGYDAEPISTDIIKKATDILLNAKSQPKVFLTSRSTVQLEWDFNSSKYLEIEVFDSKYEIYTEYENQEKSFIATDIKKCLEKIKSYDA